MASVGGVTCDYVHGEAAELRERVDVWQVPGIDGYGAQKLAQGEADFMYVLARYDTAANVETWIDNIVALQGTLVTIVDDWEISRTLCLIQKVSAPKRTPATRTTGTVACRGELTIQGVLTA